MKTVFFLLFTSSLLLGDEITFKDGTIHDNCLVRDEGRVMRAWLTRERFPLQSRVYPRDDVERFSIRRGEAWDEHEGIQDLSVTHITLDPPLVGLHGVYDYDETGAPSLAVVDVDSLKLAYEQGEALSLTAHVKNTGFAAAAPFDYRWALNGETIGAGRYGESLGAMEIVSFRQGFEWPGGDPQVRFEVIPGADEIAAFNNGRTDVLSAWGFDFVVSHRRVDYMHAHRNTLGSFSWEDYYQWHLDLMNGLFADSVYPGQPNGIEARVRLNRIVYVDEVDGVSLKGEDGLIRNQGTWFFRDSEKEKRGEWWRPDGNFNGCITEWSLPHELGHQLGLIDLYNFDYHGTGGFGYSHFFRHPRVMMHWHGPHVFHELHAAYLNRTRGMPRGAYGDFTFEVPKRCFLQVLDVNARPVAGAEVLLYQRGAKALPEERHVETSGVEWWDVEETGVFESTFFPHQPVMRGTTDARGFLELPNRPVRAVQTINGYERRPNPFGNINVVGQRGLMLALVTKRDRTDPFFLELVDFNLACVRGQTASFVYTLKSGFPSNDSPPDPACTRLEYLEGGRWRLHWTPPGVGKDSTNRKVHRYRIYRRLASEGLNFEPWDPVATVEADVFQYDLPGFPPNPAHAVGGKRYAYGISSVNERGVESGIVERFAPELERATALMRTRPYGEFHLSLEGDVGLVKLGAAGRYFDATPADRCGDHWAMNRRGTMVSTAWNRHCVHLFHENMDFSGLIGDPFKPGLIRHPTACAIDDEGNVAVVDRRVLIFDAKDLWAAAPGSGEPALVIEEPFDCRLTDVAYNHGLLVVYDERGRLHGFDRSGALLFRLELGGRVDVAVEDEKSILLLNRDRGRLFRYHRDGSLLQEIRELGGEVLKRPRGLALLEDGRVATFQDLNRILIGRFPRAREAALPELDGLYTHPVRYESPELLSKVLVINYEPLVPGADGREVRLSRRFNWNDPVALAEAYAKELRLMSGGYLLPEIVEWIDVDGWPEKIDGFVYDDATYLEAVTTRNYHEPDYIDYVKLSDVHGLAARVARGEIDEVWLFGAPGFGYYESRMYGPGAYWCNSSGIDMPEARRLFVVMGFNYERGLAEMIHDLGHRTESAMSRVYEKEYGRWQATQMRSDWERFACSDHYLPGWGAVGDCHFPCNGQKHYDYSNPRQVSSAAEDWLHYPALTGRRSLVSCETWADASGNYHLGYMRWLFSHLPRAPGINREGKLCNWWSYVFDMSTWPETR